MPLVKGTEVIFRFCILFNDPDLLSTVEFNPKKDIVLPEH